MCTVLYSKEGKYFVVIDAIPNSEDDGFHFKVNVNGKTFDSEKRAIRNGRSYLKKKRKKYYKKHPNKRPWIKRQRIYPKKSETEVVRKSMLKTLNKIYKMKKETAKILLRYSQKNETVDKLKLHPSYSKKKWNKKVSAVSGSTKGFNLTIANVMKDGDKKERKAVSKMLVNFVADPYRKTNMFYQIEKK